MLASVTTASFVLASLSMVTTIGEKVITIKEKDLFQPPGLTGLIPPKNCMSCISPRPICDFPGSDELLFQHPALDTWEKLKNYQYNVEVDNTRFQGMRLMPFAEAKTLGVGNPTVDSSTPIHFRLCFPNSVDTDAAGLDRRVRVTASFRPMEPYNKVAGFDPLAGAGKRRLDDKDRAALCDVEEQCQVLKIDTGRKKIVSWENEPLLDVENAECNQPLRDCDILVSTKTSRNADCGELKSLGEVWRRYNQCNVIFDEKSYANIVRLRQRIRSSSSSTAAAFNVSWDILMEDSDDEPPVVSRIPRDLSRLIAGQLWRDASVAYGFLPLYYTDVDDVDRAASTGYGGVEAAPTATPGAAPAANPSASPSASPAASPKWTLEGMAVWRRDGTVKRLPDWGEDLSLAETSSSMPNLVMTETTTTTMGLEEEVMGLLFEVKATDGDADDNDKSMSTYGRSVAQLSHQMVFLLESDFRFLLNASTEDELFLVCANEALADAAQADDSAQADNSAQADDSARAAEPAASSDRRARSSASWTLPVSPPRCPIEFTTTGDVFLKKKEKKEEDEGGQEVPFAKCSLILTDFHCVEKIYLKMKLKFIKDDMTNIVVDCLAETRQFPLAWWRCDSPAGCILVDPVHVTTETRTVNGRDVEAKTLNVSTAVDSEDLQVVCRHHPKWIVRSLEIKVVKRYNIHQEAKVAAKFEFDAAWAIGFLLAAAVVASFISFFVCWRRQKRRRKREEKRKRIEEYKKAIEEEGEKEEEEGKEEGLEVQTIRHLESLHRLKSEVAKTLSKKSRAKAK